MIAGLGMGAAVAPVADGQSRVRVQSSVDPSPVVQLFGGGSYIGVSIREVNADEARRSKLPGAGGVVVEDVREDSPAAKAGFKAGDIIVEFDGERVRSTRQFTRVVQETPADRQVQAVVVRDGQRTTLSVTPEVSSAFNHLREFEHLGDRLRVLPRIAPAPPAPPTPSAPPAPDVFRYFFTSSSRLGITVDALSDQLAEYFGTKEGVLVTAVRDNSAAAKAGVKAGDVIVSINGNAVRSPSDLSRRTQRLEDGDEFTLDIVRDRKPQTLKGKVEARQSRRWTI
jgi:serine protease Do